MASIFEKLIGPPTPPRISLGWPCPPLQKVRLHSVEHSGMFISGPEGPEMARLVEVGDGALFEHAS